MLQKFCIHVGLDYLEELELAGYPHNLIALLPQIANRQGPQFAAAYGVRLFKLDKERLLENGSLGTAARFGNPIDVREDLKKLPTLLTNAIAVIRDKSIEDVANRRTIAHSYVRVWLRETYPRETENEEVTGAFLGEASASNLPITNRLQSA